MDSLGRDRSYDRPRQGFDNRQGAVDRAPLKLARSRNGPMDKSEHAVRVLRLGYGSTSCNSLQGFGWYELHLFGSYLPRSGNPRISSTSLFGRDASDRGIELL